MANDIKLDENGDLAIENGDFVIAESDQQHVQDILITTVGGNKAAPLLGVGIINHLMAPQTTAQKQRLKKQITQHLKADGAQNVKVTVTDKITASATYG